MRNLLENFGKSSITEFPSHLQKEFELQNKEIEKKFSKLILNFKEKRNRK